MFLISQLTQNILMCSCACVKVLSRGRDVGTSYGIELSFGELVCVGSVTSPNVVNRTRHMKIMCDVNVPFSWLLIRDGSVNGRESNISNFHRIRFWTFFKLNDLLWYCLPTQTVKVIKNTKAIYRYINIDFYFQSVSIVD